ncbi:nucleotidyltransferase domain-containing protein [Bacillus salacetis]|uniref:nucleotidyltransferase domain-containing protein n=1 Tax=Bacillus salacetis TaxID=2315464 RepID=UPI003BA188BE
MPNQLEGLYLHGSIVLDTYIYGSSDIDFAVITNSRLTEKEIPKLIDIHEIIAGKFGKPEMDGFFTTWEDLCKERDDNDVSFPYYNGGKIGFSTQINPVTKWLL